jgi:hypothetical protein
MTATGAKKTVNQRSSSGAGVAVAASAVAAVMTLPPPSGAPSRMVSVIDPDSALPLDPVESMRMAAPAMLSPAY